MPTKPPIPCKVPACQSVTRNPSGYCDDHIQFENQMKREYDRKRLSSTMRGYGYRWQKYRKGFLSHNPLCADCKREGRIRASVVVDHIIDHKGDMTLFWEPDNHQAMCQRCHDLKTARTTDWGGRLRAGVNS